MQKDQPTEAAYTFRLPADLKAAFEEVAKAERRTMKGELVTLMEERVKRFRADEANREHVVAGEAA